MANHMSKQRKMTTIHALAEGASIRSTARLVGAHRDTVMRLGLSVGEACTRFLSDSMTGLRCKNVQIDEIWTYVKKKQGKVRRFEDGWEIGDQYVFVAIDAETKLVPAFRVGKRNQITIHCFMDDLAGRLVNRIQLSTDALKFYLSSIERSFKKKVDYGKVIKTFKAAPPALLRKYQPSKVVGLTRVPMTGNPLEKAISTAYVERQNLTMRTHMKRLNRLTIAFSKSLRHLKAAVGLHFAYQNFCRIHGTLKETPAMAAGLESSPWTVDRLLDLA